MPGRIVRLTVTAGAAILAGCASDKTVPAKQAAVAGVSGAATSVARAGAPGPPIRVAYRRLTESQYRHVLADVFGPDIAINARFEPEQRLDGLLAIGNSRMSITTPGMEQYVAVARSVADQVVDGSKSEAALGCKADEGAICGESVIRKRGPQLLRRPLTDAEVKDTMAVYAEALSRTGDSKKAIKVVLLRMLVSPDFLFRVERAEADPTTGDYRLTGNTKAERLSFLLWDSGPDDQLLAAAGTGALHTSEGLSREVDRMLASPRLRDGVRAFFIDMLRFDGFDSLSKDPSTYPLFSQAVADSAREETLRTITDLLINRQGDYRDVFTTRESVINRTLAAVYNVPYISAEKWAQITFAPDSERSGVLTQVSTMALFAHPASSSPTIRGVSLNDIFLCQPTPQPPPNVDFSKVQATQNGTVRSRLTDHMANPGCSACHRMSDPVGLTLEHFDGIGQLRKLENGQPIDVSGEIGGKKLDGAPGLGRYFHDNPATAKCLVRNVYYYSQGWPSSFKDQAYLDSQAAAFAANGYKLGALYRTMIASPEFFKVVRPEPPAAPKPAQASADASTRLGG